MINEAISLDKSSNVDILEFIRIIQDKINEEVNGETSEEDAA